MKSQNELQEDDKSIAKFLGVPMLNHFYTPICPTTGATLFLTEKELKYHTNWEWIMEVVEQLENMNCTVIIGRMKCSIEYQDLFNPARKFETEIVCGVKINAVCGAIIEFIKWQNEQK